MTRSAPTAAGAPAQGRSSVATAARALPAATRARLDDLLSATDAELRRRGVIRLHAPEERPSRGRARRSAKDAPPSSAQAASRPAAGGRRSSRAPAAEEQAPGAELLSPILVRAALHAGAALVTSTVGEATRALEELTGRDLADGELAADVAEFTRRIAAARRSHHDGRYPVDDFGFDAEWTETLLPLARLVYRKWWRVTTTGIENVPRTGGALLVSNHSGVLPLDGAMIKVAAFEEGLERHVRALIASWFFGLPVLSWFLRRSGQTLGHQDDTLRLLRSGELVLVFPEGVKGTGKPFRERYRLRRFGRGGFVAVAIRARAPIVPISVVGAEEIYPMIADIRPLADLLGMPYCPVTPTWPLLGPLGLVPLPSAWRIQFHPPVRTDLLPVETADDPGEVMRVSDEVRETIQDGLIANLMERRSVFRG